MLARRRVADDVVGSLEPVLRALPEPTGPLPSGAAIEDSSTNQVASWVRQHEGSGARRPSWAEIRSRGGGVDAGPEMRDLIDSLQRRGV